MYSYSFIVPVFNEKQNIFPTIDEIFKYHKYPNEFEILFVDDNSPDGTASEINKACSKYSNVKLIQHGKKEGIGAALTYGCKFAKHDLFIFIDADLSQSPSYIPQMIKHIESGSDMVIGSRYLKGSKKINQSAFRKYGSYLFNLFSKLILGVPVFDITHSFRVFKKDIFYFLENSITQKGHPSFLIEFTYLTALNKYKIKEVPITFIDRDYSRGISKLNIKKEIINSLILILNLLFKK